MKRKFIVASIIFGGFALSGCEASDVIGNTVDCQSICKRYADCFNQDYDVSACRDRCMDKSDADADFMKKVDMCNTCIKDEDCTSATFKCATECSQVVP